MFAYAILRAIPNKVLGVVSLFFSILVFFIFVLTDSYISILSKVNKFFVFVFVFVSVVLSWLGQCLVEDPFVVLSMIFSFLYFFVVFVLFIIYYVSGRVFFVIVYVV